MWNRGIAWVKRHAADYEIDPHRLGLVGASAGGHLASLAAVTNGRTTDSSPQDDASVKAIGVFFPPTDFLSFGGREIDPKNDPGMGVLLKGLAFPEASINLPTNKLVIGSSPSRRPAE